MERDIEIRTMTRADMDGAVAWAAEEGWNPGWNDAGIFYAVDPKGYFMAFHDGVAIGSISAVAYDQTFGFIGFFIVKSAWRGGRVGVLLGRRALEYLGPRAIGIDGVEKKEKNYLHFGFTLAYHHLRYEGAAIGGRASDRLRPADAVPWEALAAYDRRCFPAPRPAFLARWVRQPGGAALAVLEAGAVAGYGVIRPCQKGHKIGPLFADAPVLAETLFLGLLAAVQPSGPVFLDVPEVNAAALAMVRRYAMRPVFKTARMYNRPPPPLAVRNIYGVTSFELG